MSNLDDSADVFANSSTETVTENLNYTQFLKQAGKPYDFDFIDDDSQINKLKIKCKFPEPISTSSPLPLSPSVLSGTNNNTDISFIANHFVSEACNIPLRLYCPFCPTDFGFEFLLKEHIQNIHPQELQIIVRSKDGGIKFYSCMFCHAKFYIKELLPKHVVNKHQQSVAGMFTRKCNDNYAQCYFCPHKVLGKHIKRLTIHIEKKHYTNFEKLIFQHHCDVVMSPADLQSFDLGKKELSLTSVVRRGLLKLSTNDNALKSLNIKPILKRTSKYSSEKKCLNFTEIASNDNTLNGSFQAIKTRNSARRKLRFDLPESPEDMNKENHNFLNQNSLKPFMKKKKSKWLSLFKKAKNVPVQITEKPQSPKRKYENFLRKDVYTTPVFSTIGFKNEGIGQLAVLQFKCGLCLEGFDNNALLLEHLRRRHKGIKLQAQYRCGECHAKFYRNSFLVRHCWYHHTPLCLKSKPNNDN